MAYDNIGTGYSEQLTKYYYAAIVGDHRPLGETPPWNMPNCRILTGSFSHDSFSQLGEEYVAILGNTAQRLAMKQDPDNQPSCCSMVEISWIDNTSLPNLKTIILRNLFRPHGFAGDSAWQTWSYSRAKATSDTIDKLAEEAVNTLITAES